MISYRYLTISLAAILLLFSLPCHTVMAVEVDSLENLAQLQNSLKQILENDPTVTLGFTTIKTDPTTVDRVLRSLYIKEKILPYWVTTNGPGQKAEALISVLRSAEEDGLNPAHYNLTDIQKVWQSRKPDDLAGLDVMLTLAMGAYVTDMREGRAVSCLLDPKLFAAARDKDVDMQEVIRQGLSAPDLIQFPQMQAPLHDGYQSLKKVLALYKTIEAQGGWPEIPAGKTLKPDMADDRLALLVQRLTATGDLMPPVTVPLTYDEQLVKAVKHFQFRYNLEQDGVIGKNTLSALNIPARDHINKIILNMERWRWLPHTLDGRRILVNIAGFQLAAIHDENLEINMPVIVGKTHHKTPVFSHTMTYIEINPFWNIPNSIARNEMVPKMKKDPDYLKSKNIRIFKGWQENAPEVNPDTINWHTIGRGIKQYRLRQDPGPNNSLGAIKFMFPNSKNIYMHDTPTHSLFKRNNRSFSHGCIRVSQPRELALHILNHDTQGWTKERIDDLITKGKRTIVSLDSPLPVHILYRTALVSPKDGTVHFYNDVYGRDALLAQALFTDEQKTVQCRYSYGTKDQ